MQHTDTDTIYKIHKYRQNIYSTIYTQYTETGTIYTQYTETGTIYTQYTDTDTIYTEHRNKNKKFEIKLIVVHLESEIQARNGGSLNFQLPDPL